jgi:hypothetical protein
MSLADIQAMKALKLVKDIAINVKTFGAKGDGVTNDTAAIQSALNMGGVVYFPPGTYLIDTVIVKSYTKIYGAGIGITTLQSVTNPSGAMLDCRGTFGDATVKEHIEISGITFKHRSDYTRVGYGGVFIAGDYTRYCQVHECEFMNFNAHAIYLTQIDNNKTYARSWMITRCIFRDGGASSIGVYAVTEAEYIIITDCQFYQMLLCAVRIEDSANMQIQACTFLNCGGSQYGTIYLSITPNYNGGKLMVQGCAINHNNGDAIKIVNTRPNASQLGVNIANNEILVFSVAGYAGIRATGLNGGKICDNRINTYQSSDPAIVLADNGATIADYNMINDNLAMGSTAVNNTATGTHNIVTNNMNNAV